MTPMLNHGKLFTGNNMAGRLREISERERKHCQISYQKTHRSQSVFIGEWIDEWKLLQNELGISSNPEMAKTVHFFLVQFLSRLH